MWFYSSTVNLLLVTRGEARGFTLSSYADGCVEGRLLLCPFSIGCPSEYADLKTLPHKIFEV